MRTRPSTDAISAAFGFISKYFVLFYLKHTAHTKKYIYVYRLLFNNPFLYCYFFVFLNPETDLDASPK